MRNRIGIVMVMPAILVFLPAGPAALPEAGDLRDFAVFISGYESAPTRAELVAAAGDGSPADMLRLVAADRSHARFTRGRAARLLGLFPQQGAGDYLAAVMADDTEDFYVRIEAAAGFVRAFGKEHPAQTAEALSALLGSRDARLRATAVHHLRKLESDRAIEILDDHRLVERNLSVFR
ncbi:MAG: hypothetical protein ABIJ56_02605 [Pseudomonadota bacterium]